MKNAHTTGVRNEDLWLSLFRGADGILQAHKRGGDSIQYVRVTTLTGSNQFNLDIATIPRDWTHFGDCSEPISGFRALPEEGWKDFSYVFVGPVAIPGETTNTDIIAYFRPPALNAVPNPINIQLTEPKPRMVTGYVYLCRIRECTMKDCPYRATGCYEMLDMPKDFLSIKNVMDRIDGAKRGMRTTNVVMKNW